MTRCFVLKKNGIFEKLFNWSANANMLPSVGLTGLVQCVNL